MADFTFPTSAELMEIEQEKLPRLIEDDPIFNLFPIVNVDAHLLMWEQLDNFVGLQQIRGLNGQPSRVKQTGLNRYQMTPGVYGEFETIDEEQLTMRRQIATFGQPVSIDDLVTVCQDKLLNRRLDRIRWILWTLLTTGTFSVSTTAPGGVMHTDTYSLQTHAGSDWSTVSTGTPLADFRAAKLLARGKSVSFGSGATAFMNQTTANLLLANTNSNDIAGRRTSGLATIDNINQVNQLLTGDDLPTIQVWDDGYIDDDGNFQLWIPNDKVIIVGKRTSGVSLGEYRMTRNANNPSMAPGVYTRVIDRGEDTIPRTIEVHDGHNGGPVIFFPGGVVIMSV